MPARCTRREALALAVAAAALASCLACAIPPATPLDPRGRTWLSPHGQDHPLVGHCIVPGRAEHLAPEEIAERLAAARHILFGETHDNPDHHLLQAEAIRALVAAGRRPAVAFEMIAEDRREALRRHLAANPRDAAGLGAALGWAESGWPDWAIYQPVAEAALEAGLALEPANLDRATVRELSRGASHDLRARLGLDEPLPEALARSLRREIVEAHCGYADDAAVEGMALGQRARDAQMALRLHQAGAADGAVLIAGAGHCRTDRGVPYYLRRHDTRARVLSLAFIEVSPERLSAGDYADAKDEPQLPYDLVYFTPRIDARDACQRFREQLEKMRPKPAA